MGQTAGMQGERLDAIRSHLYANGFSTIQSLADSVGASLATIRRDLQVLEREGLIDRVHGGARIAEGSSVEVAFQERAKRNLVAKRAIAAAAYELLAPHATVFLDAGTTVLQLSRLIRINPLPLRIFTNGLAVAQEFLNVPDLEVAVLGGQLRSENASLVGPQAEAMRTRGHMVVSRTEQLPWRPDVIHGHHSVMTMMAAILLVCSEQIRANSSGVRYARLLCGRSSLYSVRNAAIFRRASNRF